MSDYYTEQPLPLFAARAPSVNGSLTSAEAADSLDTQTLNAMQRRVYEFLAWRPSTDEEIATELAMNPSTVRPRRIELARRGFVVKCGTKRTASGRNADVWKSTAESV
jgi:predicted ArsR family transcriptional regulator